MKKPEESGGNTEYERQQVNDFKQVKPPENKHLTTEVQEIPTKPFESKQFLHI